MKNPPQPFPWIPAMLALEQDNKLIVVCYSKEDVESAIDAKLSNEDWDKIRQDHRKYGGEPGWREIEDIAREQIRENNTEEST